MRAGLSGFCSLLTLCGCSALVRIPTPPPTTLDRVALRASRPQSVKTSSVQPASSFEVFTSLADFIAVTTGLAGAAVNSSVAGMRGREILTDYGIGDPAGRIEGLLVDALATKYDLTVVDDPRTRADLAIRVRTDVWSVAPVAIGKYGLQYRGTLLLFDMRNRRTLVKATCDRPLPVESSDSPEYDALLADGATGLKGEMEAVAQSCADELRTSVLGIYR